MMSRSLRQLAPVLFALAVFCAAPRVASAEPLFTMQVSDGVSPTVTRSFDEITASLDTLRASALNALFRPTNPSFNGYTSPLTATFQARGLTVNIRADQGSPDLVVDIPAAHITKRFTGRTRADSANDLTTWLQQNSAVAQALVANSPADPIAGNPNSLQARLVD